MVVMLGRLAALKARVHALKERGTNRFSPSVALQPYLLHRRLVLVGELPVHGDMLIDLQGFSLGVTRDELKLGIRQP